MKTAERKHLVQDQTAAREKTCENSLSSQGCEPKTDTMSESNQAGLRAAKSGGKASAARRAEQATKLERFRAELIERVGNPDPVQESLIDSCCALYLVVLRRC